jgi:hypothetical protein
LRAPPALLPAGLVAVADLPADLLAGAFLAALFVTALFGDGLADTNYLSV